MRMNENNEMVGDGDDMTILTHLFQYFAFLTIEKIEKLFMQKCCKNVTGWCDEWKSLKIDESDKEVFYLLASFCRFKCFSLV